MQLGFSVSELHASHFSTCMSVWDSGSYKIELGFFTIQLVFLCGEFSYRDEDGEPLMDFDEDIQSDRDEPQQHLLYDEDDAVYDRRERSPTPVYNDSKAKPRKRLIKKSSSDKDSGPVDFGLDDDEGDVGGDYGGDEDDMAGMVKESYLDGGKRKKDIGEKRKSVEKKRKGDRGEKNFKVRKNGGGRMRDHEADPEMKEMWDTIAGGDSEVCFVLH